MKYYSLYSRHIFFFNINYNQFFLRSMSFISNKEVLVLKNPKFVSLLIYDNSQKLNVDPVTLINPSFPSVDRGKFELSSNTKYDKKNKLYAKGSDNVESKKYKIKFKKKSRDNMSLDSDDLFLVTSNEDELNNKLIKKSKLNKNRNKQKKHTDILSQVNDRQHISNQDSKANKSIILDKPLTIKELAIKLQIHEAEIIRSLFLDGISVTLNQVIDISMAKQVAKNYNFNILNTDIFNENKFPLTIKDLSNHLDGFISRSPIITILGHIDHGKTTLLDSIRQTNVASNESGGITQSVTGYEIDYTYKSQSLKLVFLDTPGHEAFIAMRTRGVQVTDIVVLVVAADDGLKPQTFESIKHIKSNNLPCIVAINKIDKDDINVLKVKQELAEQDLVSTEWGGLIPMVEVSALKKLNLEDLLNEICLMYHSRNLQANPNISAEGTILESYLDKSKGPIANLLVQNGSLLVGDIIVSASSYGRVKALINSQEITTNKALPSSLIKILGFSSVPIVGSQFRIVSSEKQARQLVNNYLNNVNPSNQLNILNSRLTLKSNKSSIRHVNLIIKANTQGSIEAIINALSKICQDKVQLNIVNTGSSNVSSADIDLAIASNSIVILFNFNLSSPYENLIKKSAVLLYSFNVIYDLVDFISQHMLSLIEPEYSKVLIGTAIVKNIFGINKGVVAGCLVNNGKLLKDSFISVYRSNNLIYEGHLNSLKVIKDDVNEVLAGNECGVMSHNCNDWQIQDEIKSYRITAQTKTLSANM
uniref:Translation initiation factor IF-2, chloroplastic n=1 Tax=Gastroclonium compressum TaxID=1852973 RepID=A0A173G015_GASCM|nr:translation initiation factor IF-2 [Coeloseira compressa]ANH09622.1 translation initiation factor IF-2 [Coeloseira compressa]